MYKKVSAFSLVFFLCIVRIAFAQGVQIENPSVQIETEPNESSPAQFPVSDTHTLVSPKISFPLQSEARAITVSLTPLTIDFGQTHPGEPLTRTANLNVSKQIDLPVSIFVTQNHDLLSLENQSIAPTHCDNGSCTSFSGSEWKSPLTFGYGIRCEKSNTENGCSSTFKDSQSFIQIQNEADAGINSVYVLHQNVSKGTLDFIFKLNLSPTASLASYENAVNITVVPQL
jgi:hypothetical protein